MIWQGLRHYGRVVETRDASGVIWSSTDDGQTWRSQYSWARPAGLRDRARRMKETAARLLDLDEMMGNPGEWAVKAAKRVVDEFMERPTPRDRFGGLENLG